MSLYADIDSTLFWVTQETSIPSGVREGAQILRLRLADREKRNALLLDEVKRLREALDSIANGYGLRDSMKAELNRCKSIARAALAER